MPRARPVRVVRQSRGYRADEARVPVGDVSLFYKEAGPNYHFAAHRHRTWQWFVCVHGDMTIAIDGVPHALGPEQSVLVAPGCVRETWCRHKAPGYVVGNFSDRGLGLEAIAARVIRVPGDHRDDLRALCAELRTPGGDSDHLVAALTVRLLIGLKRGAQAALAASTPAPLDAAGQRDVVARADAFLARNLHRTVTRREVAAAVHLSEPHLGRVVRAATGATVLERLTEMRLARAKSLLVESTLSVSQIANQVGIASFSHFARLFRRAVGVTPTDYRRAGGRAWQ